MVWESKYGFGEPFVDVDEWRDEPVRHRYVHGGFHNSDAEFSFYFPPLEEGAFRGRFFQFLQGGSGGNAHVLTQTVASVGAWPFHLAGELGGYLVESNQGVKGYGGLGRGPGTPIALTGASSECARYSKVLAEEMYGSPVRYGYVWGDSGGGLRTTLCMEREPDVYDGGVPLVIGRGAGAVSWSAWYLWGLHSRALTDEVKEAINDALAPGGSGDPYQFLDSEQREALSALLGRGWPRGVEIPFGEGLSVIALIQQRDPTYFDDFWNAPGYLGHDSPARVAGLLLDEAFTVESIVTRDMLPPTPDSGFVDKVTGFPVPARTNPRGVEHKTLGRVEATDGPPPRVGVVPVGDAAVLDKVSTARLTVLTGAAAGKQFPISVDDRKLFSGMSTGRGAWAELEPGDQVRVDNRDAIAFGHAWRYGFDFEMWAETEPATGHRVLHPEFAPVGELLRDGRPVNPERLMAWARDDDQTGRFEGKMIHVSGTHDFNVWPTWIPSYGRLVRSQLGDALDDHYRYWWADKAPHHKQVIDATGFPWLVDFEGITAQALRDVVTWVETGVAPSPTTKCEWIDGGLHLDQDPAQRGGVQPLVWATANGGVRADVKVGEAVTFVGTAAQPVGTGSIVFARWDFDNDGGYEVESKVEGHTERVEVEETHAFEAPGTYFVNFRVGGHRNGAAASPPYAENMSRVRVVVS